MKKYELTSITYTSGDLVLYRIKALKDFSDVIAGDLGGWVQSEENLSQDGNCWIYDEAKVSGKARVYREARIYGNARIYEEAQVYGEARIYGNVRVYEEARIYGNARVYEEARVYGNAEVYGEARVYGKAEIHEEARVYGEAKVYGKAEVSYKAKIARDGQIKNTRDYLTVGPIGSKNEITTFYRREGGKIGVICSCFIGGIEEFESKVKEHYGYKEHDRNYLLAINFTKSYFN